MAAAGLAGIDVASHLVPGRQPAFAIAHSLLVAGVGDGLVIPSNQTHTLAEVPVAEGGSAAGVIQTGQRIGSAIGMAAASVFFAALTTARGNYLRAFQGGLMVVVALVVAALVIALLDMIAERRG